MNTVAEELCSLTLAAGAGSRMPGDMPPKPCCRIGPVSVIENALQTCERAGIHRHVVVVGYEAQAVAELGRHIGPDRSCVVACSPGRINLMGRHVDHQGGVCNLMAVDRRVVAAASPREDDRLNLWSAQPSGSSYRSFSFAELGADGTEWGAGKGCCVRPPPIGSGAREERYADKAVG